MSPGDRLAKAVRLAREAEVLEERIGQARRSRRQEGAGERAAREAVLADLETRAAEVRAEAEELAREEEP